MARQSLSVQASDRDGIVLSFTSIGVDGVSVPNDGRLKALVKNSSGGPVNADFITSITVDGQAVDDRSVSVADGDEVLFGPFPENVYGTTLQVDGQNLDIAFIR